MAVFRQALQLRAQVDVREGRFSYIWPCAFDLFDHQTMLDVEDPDYKDMAKIRIALFPALIQRATNEEQRRGESDEKILKARVLNKERWSGT